MDWITDLQLAKGPTRSSAFFVAMTRLAHLQPFRSLSFKDIVADLVQLADRLFKVSDAQGRPTFVDLEHLHEHPMVRSRVARKVPSCYVSCDRPVSITPPKQVNKHRLSLRLKELSSKVHLMCAA